MLMNRKIHGKVQGCDQGQIIHVFKQHAILKSKVIIMNFRVRMNTYIYELLVAILILKIKNSM